MTVLLYELLSSSLNLVPNIFVMDFCCDMGKETLEKKVFFPFTTSKTKLALPFYQVIKNFEML